MKIHLLLLSIIVVIGSAKQSYTGYSGAPGSKGSCASSCHGSGTGTITVSGFPAIYEPGKSYTISVGHSGGSTIANFNASTRKGSTSAVAGIFSSGTKTAVYSVSGYESGVRASSNSIDAATFVWTAPAAGSGNVALYVSGSQGNKSGPNTTIIIPSSEQGATSVNGSASVPGQIQLNQNYPNPFNPATEITFHLPSAAAVTMTVFDILGNEVVTLVDEKRPAGINTVSFNAGNISGGVYFYRLTAGSFVQTKKMLLLK